MYVGLLFHGFTVKVLALVFFIHFYDYFYLDFIVVFVRMIHHTFFDSYFFVDPTKDSELKKVI